MREYRNNSKGIITLDLLLSPILEIIRTNIILSSGPLSVPANEIPFVETPKIKKGRLVLRKMIESLPEDSDLRVFY